MQHSTAKVEFGWRSASSVEGWLYAEPYRFEFTQAVRLLEILVSRGESTGPEHRRVPLGVGPDPARERVKLRAAVGFGFPAQEIADLAPATDADSIPDLITNFFALAGGRSPLPDWVAEMLLQQQRVHDTGLRDFLDIFHHRLLSMLYRLRLQYRPWLDPAMMAALAPDGQAGQVRARNAMAGRLFSFMGLGQPELRTGLPIGEEELLPYTGLLWHEPRSADGMRRLIEHALAIPVIVRQHLGVWRPIEPEDRTLLGSLLGKRKGVPGRKGRNNVLGRSTVLGRRVWDPDGRFDLVLGPLPLAAFEALLPGGKNHERLQTLVRFYAGEFFDVHLELQLADGEAPRLRLGRSRLSQTTWFVTGSPASTQHVRIPLLA